MYTGLVPIPRSTRRSRCLWSIGITPESYTIHTTRHIAHDTQELILVAVANDYRIHLCGAALEIHAVHERRHVSYDAHNSVHVPVVQSHGRPVREELDVLIGGLIGFVEDPIVLASYAPGSKRGSRRR